MKTKLNEQIHVLLTCLLAFFIPCIKAIVPTLIILIGITYIFNFRNISDGVKRLIKNTGLLLMLICYGIYLIGLFYSTNLSFGREVIETKLSLMILPIIYASYSQTTKINFEKYLAFFIAGCTVYALFSIIYAFYCFYKPVYYDFITIKVYLGANYFYYTYLSRFFHPSYTSMFSATAISSILYLIDRGKFKKKKLGILLLILFTIYILLLSSKAGWLVLALLGVGLIYHAIKYRKIIMGISVLLFVSGSFMFFNIYNTPDFSHRIPAGKDVFNAIKGKNEKNEKIVTGNDGTVSRILVWKSSVKLFSNHLVFGVGTGDSKDQLMLEYEKRGMKRERETELNSHNQYLNTAISLGVVGLLALASMLIHPFMKTHRNHYFLFYSFILIVGINLLFESMFETQAGIVFFVFFNTLFCIQFNTSNQAETN